MNEDIRPVAEHVIECRHLIVEEMGSLGRTDHPVVLLGKRVLHTHFRGVPEPIDRLAHKVSRCYSCCGVREVHQQVLPLHRQTRHDRIEDVVLRIDEGVA